MTDDAPFRDLAVAPAEHFKLLFYAAVLRFLRQVAAACGSEDELLRQFPFLASYRNEISSRLPDRMPLEEAAAWWLEAVNRWAPPSGAVLPLRSLQQAAALSHDDILAFLHIGLSEEDPRFGVIYEWFNGAPGHRRPTAALLNAWWLEEGRDFRSSLRTLEEIGLIDVSNPEAPRLEWQMQVNTLLWDVMRGANSSRMEGLCRFTAAERLASPEDLVLPPELIPVVDGVPRALEQGDVGTIIVRGPARNGRRSLLGAIARRLGRGILEVQDLKKAAERHSRHLGALATLLRAVPVFVIELGPGETAELPKLEAYDGPVGVVMGRCGGLTGPHTDRAVTLDCGLLGPEERERLWLRTSAVAPRDVKTVGAGFRLTSGNISRVAGLAQSEARIRGRPAAAVIDIQRACRNLARQTLDTLAAYVPVSGDWNSLAAATETLAELRNLEMRCRYREQLHRAVGIAAVPQSNCGVRALFKGPSGTGKTLAAKLLASVLKKDLYRLDLSAVVNKYIGETEKNLNRVFSRAEELDVMLLIDEGDALMGPRTSVHSSNDRYANLETNFLLQRLETFEGIVIVTTNAADRIDSAFQRRMDVVVDFHPPDAAERWAIWQLHLPARYTVDEFVLNEIAARCRLNGGQIRNAVLHASMLALEEGAAIRISHLEIAIEREYRKGGAVCPLRLGEIAVVRE